MRVCWALCSSQPTSRLPGRQCSKHVRFWLIHHPSICANHTSPAPCLCPSLPYPLPTNIHPDFIYADYLTANRRSEFQQLVWQIAQDYSKATLLLRLPGFVPMPAFQAIEDVPLVVRHARSFPGAVRTALNIPPEARVVILMHGGHNVVMSVREDFIPPGWVCVICNGGRPLSPEPLPPNFRLAPADAFTPDLVAASDCVLGKIGYGWVRPGKAMKEGTTLWDVFRGCMHMQGHRQWCFCLSASGRMLMCRPGC